MTRIVRPPTDSRVAAASCQGWPVRVSEFFRLVDEEFGVARGRSLVHDQHLTALGDRTPAQALAAGAEPRTVWLAMCEALDVPPERRLGRDRLRRRPGRSA
jgi:hypothetical protein